MSSAFITSVNSIIQGITIYYGFTIFSLGVIGESLNVIIFLSLKTFRQSSCAFYLTFMSMFDLGRFFLTILPYIMRWGFSIDWGALSIVFCKIRPSFFTICTLCSMTCLCLATIDQYFATCFRPQWQRFCNIKLAYRLTAISIIIWIIQAIPYFIYYEHTIYPLTNQVVCLSTNTIVNNYLAYGYFLVFTNLVTLVTIVFGLMAYYNARNLAHRTVPLVRRELDKQLTVMVLVQVLINFCTFVPYSSYIMVSTLYPPRIDPVLVAKYSLASNITTHFYIISFASPFYTNVCVSKRFRRQVKYVLYGMHIKKLHRNRIGPDQSSNQT